MARDSSARGGARRSQRGRSLSSLPYTRGIDGMRALAVIAVMVYHANHEWLPGGFLGVEVFFVISGYLITLLLIGEHERNGKISIRHFWARRARRLLPALFFMLLLLITYTALFERETLGQLRGDVLAGLGYASNWYQIWVGQGYTAPSAFAPLRHLWSLAVEEQFYVFWPIIMVVLIGRGRHRLPSISRWLVVAAIAITVVVGFLYQPGREAIDGKPVGDAFWRIGGRSFSKTDTLYLSTISRSTGLLIGAAFAMIWRPRAVMRGPLRSKGLILDVLALVGLGWLGLLAWDVHLVTPEGADPFLFRGGFFAVAVASVFVIAAVTHGATWSGSLLGTRVLNWVGTRSYGMYLYHWPIYQIIRKAAGNPLSIGEFALAMVVTAVITEFSYRFIEMPIRRQRLGPWFQRLRHRRDPVPRRIIGFGAATCVALVGFAGASMATAELTLSDQEIAQQQGQEVVVDFGALANPTTTTIASPTTRPTTTRPTTTRPPTTVGVVAPGCTETVETTSVDTTDAADTTEATDCTAVETTEAAETTEVVETTDVETTGVVETTDVVATGVVET
ncbi:MAG: acyltransferase, partial [Actinomycetota bacterium]|nr:acyltransferase [Actinomycetota bacterium]